MRRLLSLLPIVTTLACAARPRPAKPPTTAPSVLPTTQPAPPPTIDAHVAEVERVVSTARAAIGRGDPAGAEKILAAALLVDERSARLLTELALVHRFAANADHDAERTATARRVIERAIAADPSYAPAELAHGWIASDLHDYAEAAAAFDRARRIDPRLFPAHSAAGELRLRLRDPVAAEAAYRAAIAVRPDAYDAWLGLARALRARIEGADAATWDARIDAATRAIDQAIALRPDRPEAYLGAAALAMEHAVGRDGGVSLTHAERLLKEFLSRAHGVPGLERGEGEARRRLAAIDAALHCRKESERARKERELEELIKNAGDEAFAADGP